MAEEGKHRRTPGGLVRKSFYLEPELEKELSDLAHREGRSQGDVLREAVREYLESRKEERG